MGVGAAELLPLFSALAGLSVVLIWETEGLVWFPGAVTTTGEETVALFGGFSDLSEHRTGTSSNASTRDRARAPRPRAPGPGDSFSRAAPHILPRAEAAITDSAPEPFWKLEKVAGWVKLLPLCLAG